MTLSYKTLLNNEALNRNWNEAQTSNFDRWRQNISYVESNNTPTRTQNDSPKGIGRGKYQYELSTGSGTNKTAVNRFKKYLNKNGFSLKDLSAEDQKVLAESDPDFSKLSSDAQDMIFLADKSLAPETSLDDLVNGNISFSDAWKQWHWKGTDPKEAEQRQKHWDSTSVFKWQDPTERDIWKQVYQEERDKRQPEQREGTQGSVPPHMQWAGLGAAPSTWGLFGLLGRYLANSEREDTLNAMGEAMYPPVPELPTRYSFEEQQAMSDAMSGVGNDQVASVNYNEAPPRSAPEIYVAPPPPPPEPQYNTMEELLQDKGLINPLMNWHWAGR